MFSVPSGCSAKCLKWEEIRGELILFLAQKLEKKQRHKEAKKVKDRCASAMLVNRRPDSRILQERSASAMTVLKEELKNTSNSLISTPSGNF